jgi:hypothetical protein
MKLLFVFDLDETIGNFSQLSITWKLINKILVYHKHEEFGQIEFNILLDEFELVLRPNIINILKYISFHKDDNINVILYTNNQISERWVILIKNYLEEKIKKPLFDQVIYAYKIKNKVVDKNRTGHNKTYQDLLRCGNISKSTKICFIDDKYFKELENENVYYIQLNPYIYKISWEELLLQLDNLDLINYKTIHFKEMLNTNIKINTDYNNLYDDGILFKKIVYFLKKNRKNTFKRKLFQNKTLKKSVT